MDWSIIQIPTIGIKDIFKITDVHYSGQIVSYYHALNTGHVCQFSNYKHKQDRKKQWKGKKNAERFQKKLKLKTLNEIANVFEKIFMLFDEKNY